MLFFCLFVFSCCLRERLVETERPPKDYHCNPKIGSNKTTIHTKTYHFSVMCELLPPVWMQKGDLVTCIASITFSLEGIKI